MLVRVFTSFPQKRLWMRHLRQVLFSFSCWAGKLFMFFNLPMTSVHRSERDGGRDLGVCYSWMIFCVPNVSATWPCTVSIFLTELFSLFKQANILAVLVRSMEKCVSKSEKGEGGVPLRQQVNTWADVGAYVSHLETSNTSHVQGVQAPGQRGQRLEGCHHSWGTVVTFFLRSKRGI